MPAVCFLCTRIAAADPAPPGEMVDLGGRRLHLNCTGSGTPAVIVENGGGSFSVEWALVQSDAARQTRICTHDRAGYAWSDRSAIDDGIEQIVSDLNLLLPFDRLPPNLQVARQWAFEKAVRDFGWLPNTLAAAESWRQEFTALRRQRLSSPHPLGGLPLRVLERERDTTETWHVQQVQLAALSSNSKLIKAAGSGHMIHLERPDLVVDAIRDLVREVRRGRAPVRLSPPTDSTPTTRCSEKMSV